MIDEIERTGDGTPNSSPFAEARKAHVAHVVADQSAPTPRLFPHLASRIHRVHYGLLDEAGGADTPARTPGGRWPGRKEHDGGVDGLG